MFFVKILSYTIAIDVAVLANGGWRMFGVETAACNVALPVEGGGEMKFSGTVVLLVPLDSRGGGIAPTTTLSVAIFDLFLRPIVKKSVWLVLNI